MNQPLSNIAPAAQTASQMKDLLVAGALGGYMAGKQMGMSPPPMPGAVPAGLPPGAPPMPAGASALAGAPSPVASAAPPPAMAAPAPAAMAPGAAPPPGIDMNAPTPLTDRFFPPAQPQPMPAFAEGGVMGGMPPEMPLDGEMSGAPAGRDLEPDQLMQNVTPAADLFQMVMRLKQNGESPDMLKGELLGTSGLEDAVPEGVLEPAPDAFVRFLNEQDHPANEVIQDMIEAYESDVGIVDQLWQAVKMAVADPEERKELPRDLLKIAAQNGASPSAKKATPAAKPMTEPTAPPMPMPKGKVA